MLIKHTHTWCAPWSYVCMRARGRTLETLVSKSKRQKKFIYISWKQNISFLPFLSRRVNSSRQKSLLLFCLKRWDVLLKMQTHYKNLILFISISALFHLLTSNFLFESWLDWRAEQNIMEFFLAMMTMWSWKWRDNISKQEEIGCYHLNGWNVCLSEWTIYFHTQKIIHDHKEILW